MSRRARWAAIVGLLVTLIGVPGVPIGTAKATDTVTVRMKNFRYCAESSVTDCFAQHQAYVADPNTGEPVAPIYNPVGVIDVHAGDTITWRYDDGPAGVANPLNCDSFNGGLFGEDFGVDNLRCPGHEVVLAASGPGGVRQHLGFVPRLQLGGTITWTVPADLEPGTIIPYFCNVGNGFHHKVGMTGALQVVA